MIISISNWIVFHLVAIVYRPQLYIPPSDLYTSMEKLVLPFDHETWTGLGIIFSFSIISMCIINQLPKHVRRLFFGKIKHSTVFKIFQTFFGISEKNSPDGNFARITFISFIFWCLVIRTAYQGKLFEFTTTAIRKPVLKTLEALKDRNYSIYFSHAMAERGLLIGYLKKVIG
jgi:hypothetical protein